MAIILVTRPHIGHPTAEDTRTIGHKPNYDEIAFLEALTLDADEEDWERRFQQGIAQSQDEPTEPQEWQDREGE